MTANHKDDLAILDPSRPGTFADGSWREHFSRLRAEDPVHYCADSPNGPFGPLRGTPILKLWT